MSLSSMRTQLFPRRDTRRTMAVDPSNPAGSHRDSYRSNHPLRTPPAPMLDKSFCHTQGPTKNTHFFFQKEVEFCYSSKYGISCSPPWQLYLGTWFDYRSNHLYIWYFRNFVLWNWSDLNRVRFCFAASVCPWCEASIQFPCNFANTYHIASKSFAHHGRPVVYFNSETILLTHNFPIFQFNLKNLLIFSRFCICCESENVWRKERQ